MATTEIEIVSPDSTLYSGEAEMLVCRTVEGEIAFLADHTPLIGALEPCIVRVVQESGDEERLAVGGGFVEVRDNRVILLADLAVMDGDVDVEAARADQSDAEERLRSDEDDQSAETDLKWAEARLELAGQASSRQES